MKVRKADATRDSLPTARTARAADGEREGAGDGEAMRLPRDADVVAEPFGRTRLFGILEEHAQAPESGEEACPVRPGGRADSTSVTAGRASGRAKLYAVLAVLRDDSKWTTSYT